MQKTNLLWASVLAATLLGTFTFPTLLGSILHLNHSSSDDNNFEHDALAASLPLSIDSNYHLSERAGDAKSKTSSLQIDENFVDPENHCEFCIRIDYKPGSQGIASAAYSTNGKSLELSGAKSIHFFARGEHGGEKVKFDVVGKDAASQKETRIDHDKLFTDKKFALDTKFIKLANVWKPYQIDLGDIDRTDLTGVTHPFAIELLKGKTANVQVVYLKAIVVDSKQTTNPLTIVLTTTGNSTTNATDATSSSAANASGIVEPFTVKASANTTKGTPSDAIKFSGKVITGGVSPYSYEWDFDDSQSDKGKVVSHVFSETGKYNVTLTVSDSKDRTASASVIVNISTSSSAKNMTTPVPQTTPEQDTKNVNNTNSSSREAGSRDVEG